MPVKNKNRQTNSGYEGVITGLNDKEKKVLEDAGIGGGGTPILDLSPYYNRDTNIVSQEGMSLLTNKILNNEIVGISLGGEFTCMLLDGVYGATIDFLSRVIGDYGYRVKVSIATEDGKVSQKTEYASLTFPSTLPSSQLIPSITTTNTQQNLTIGNGLTIENGVLKTTGGGSGSGFNLYDCIFNLDAENFNSETMSLTEVGLNKLNDMFVNGKLLGLNDGDPVLDASNSYFSYYRLLTRNSTHYKFAITAFQDGHMEHMQINIERQTGAAEFIGKILTATDA